MNFIVHNKKELAEKIALNVKMVDKNSLMSSLSNLKLEVCDSVLTITSFDGNNCVITNIEIENLSGENASILVDSSSLKGIVDTLLSNENNPIEFRLIEESSEMVVKSKRRLKMKVILNTVDFDITPDAESFREYKKVSLKRSDLLESVNKLSKCVAINGSKPILEAINFIVEGSSCDLVSLDGYRLGLNKFDCISEDNFKTSVSAYKLKSVLKDIPANEDDLIELKSDGRYTLIQSSEISVFIREIEGNIAPYKTLLNKSFTHEILVNVKEMISIVKASMMVTTKDNKVIKIKFVPGESLLTFTSKGEIIVDFDDNMEVSVENTSGEDLEIAFNATYLLDVLMGIKSEKARLFMKESLTPVYIEPEDNNKEQYMILPVRLGVR